MKRPEIVLGLLCGGQFSGDMVVDLIKSGGVKNRKLKDFAPRKKKSGWPGEVYFMDEEGKEYYLPGAKRTKLRHYYTNYRCIQCFDYHNIYADISFGDPWAYEGIWEREKLKKGYTIAFVRTKKGLDVMEEAMEAGVISATRIDCKEILKFNNVDYVFPKVLHVQKALEKLEMPNIYQECKLCDRITKKVNLRGAGREQQYYKRYLKYSYRYYSAENSEKAKRLVKIEKCKNLISMIPDRISYYVSLLKRIIKKYRNRIAGINGKEQKDNGSRGKCKKGME